MTKVTIDFSGIDPADYNDVAIGLGGAKYDVTQVDVSDTIDGPTARSWIDPVDFLYPDIANPDYYTLNSLSDLFPNQDPNNPIYTYDIGVSGFREPTNLAVATPSSVFDGLGPADPNFLFATDDTDTQHEIEGGLGTDFRFPTGGAGSFPHVTSFVRGTYYVEYQIVGSGPDPYGVNPPGIYFDEQVFGEGEAYHDYEDAVNTWLSDEVAAPLSAGSFTTAREGHKYAAVSFADTGDQVTVFDAINFFYNYADAPTTFIGSKLDDQITGGNGGITFIGTAGDDKLTGGLGNDDFDYQTDGFSGFYFDPQGFSQDAPGSGFFYEQHLDGGGQTAGPGGGDDLLLPGALGALDPFGFDPAFTYIINFQVDPSLPVSWANTQTMIQYEGDSANGAFLELQLLAKNIEKVEFKDPLSLADSDPVTFFQPLLDTDTGMGMVHDPLPGNIATEMLQLTAEVYGPISGFHYAEPMAYQTQDIPGYYAARGAAPQFPDPAFDAEFRGWYPLNAIELGMHPADYGDYGTLRYSLTNGYYAATQPSQLLPSVPDDPEGNALVLEGMVNGQRTLAIAFRGTDGAGDFKTFANFNNYYALFRPLIDAVKAYYLDTDNGISQILLAGHSLGSTAVQYLMHELPANLFNVKGYTAGSPGADVVGQTSEPRIENFVHTDDPVPKVPDISGPITVSLAEGIVTAATAGLASTDLGAPLAVFTAQIANFLHNVQAKTRVGGDILINSEIGSGIIVPAEHGIPTYVLDSAKLFALASDDQSPFHSSDVAAALRSGVPYHGVDVQIAPGTLENDVIHPLSTDDYDLGGAGNDQFVINQTIRPDALPQISAGPNGRIIDGGAGTDRITFIAVQNSQIDVSETGSAAVLQYRGPYSGAVLGTVGTATHVELLFFPNDLEGNLFHELNGYQLRSQHPTANSTVAVDPTVDVTDATAGHVTVNGTAGADTVLSGKAAIVNGGPGDDALVSVGASGQTNSVGAFTHALGDGGDTLKGEDGDDSLTAQTQGNTLDGGPGADSIQINAGANKLIGGSDADVFGLGLGALADAQTANPQISDLKDYDQGNAVLFDGTEGDQIDVSGITGAAAEGGAAGNALVRLVDDPSNSHVLLQVDADGTAGGIHWTTIARLDGLHEIESVDVITDSAQPGAAFVPLSNAGHFGDFDGDGKADLVWRNDDGTVATWSMNGGTVTAGHFLTGVSADWHILGTGDFNGDGTTDIFWLNDNGSLLDWQMASASTIGSSFGVGTAPANSELDGIGDVDGDHKDDLIWREQTTGAVTITTMAGASNTLSLVGNDWRVVGVGDFNGDGNADIMFRNESQGVNAAWLMNGVNLSNVAFYPGVPNDWHVEASGDFDGNGSADLFWHNDNGGNAVWLLDDAGNIEQAAFFDGVGPEWHVVGSGDFDGRSNNGHPIDDLVWRNDNGATAVWLMNGTGTPAVSFPGGVPADWATQAHHYDYV